MTSKSRSRVATTNAQYGVALARAFAGALIFCLPLLMTMEMWWLGFYLEPWRLVLFTLANIVLLYFLSKVAGFEESHNWIDDVLDAFAAYFVASVTASALLYLIGAIRPDMTLAEVVGMIAIQSVPGSFGAMIGAKLLGDGEEIEKSEPWRDTYSGQLFLMLAGALFLSFAVAPTEEMILIGYQIEPSQALMLMIAAILLLHAILYLVGFHGQEGRLGRNHLSAFSGHTLPGFAIAVGAGLYILWSFGRLDEVGLADIVMSATVIAFPAAIGAGVARVVV